MPDELRLPRHRAVLRLNVIKFYILGHGVEAEFLLVHYVGVNSYANSVLVAGTDELFKRVCRILFW